MSTDDLWLNHREPPSPQRSVFWLNVFAGFIWGVFTFFLQFPLSWLLATLLSQETIPVELVDRETHHRTVHRSNRSHHYRTWSLSLRTPDGRTAVIDASKSVFEATHPVSMIGSTSIELSRTRYLKVPVTLLVTRGSIFGDQDFKLLKIDTQPRVSSYDLRPDLVLVIGALALNIIFYVTAMRSLRFKLHNPISILLAATGLALGMVVIAQRTVF